MGKSKGTKFNHYYGELFGINLYWFRGRREKYSMMIKGEFEQKALRKVLLLKALLKFIRETAFGLV